MKEMKNLAELMSIYQRYHAKKITKITHFMGVPCIIFGLQILLSWPHVSLMSFSFSLAWMAAFILLVYYAFLDVYLALVTAIFLLPLTYLAQVIAGDRINVVAITWFVIVFIIGWIAQLIGHRYEGNHPAFVDNFFQVFVAPIFLVAELVFALGFRKDLQKKILHEV
jgi:uncharacterized membrane protein YGL010W